MLPAYIFHADWGVNASKRWLASAKLGSTDRYVASEPDRIGDHSNLIGWIRGQICNGGSALVGFDFPIGLPAHYARLARVREFNSFLEKPGHGAWADFYNVAQEQSEISPRRILTSFGAGAK